MSPQIGSKCPSINQFQTFESGFCLHECQAQCVPPSILVQIENAVKKDKHVGRYLSVTSLLGYPIPKAAGCLRQTYLERVMDYFTEPWQNWYAVRGKILHHILENPGLDEVIADAEDFITGSIQRGETTGNESALMQRWNDIKAELNHLSKSFPNNPIPDWVSEVEYEYPLGMIDGEPWFLRGTPDAVRQQVGHLIDYKTIGDNGLPIVAKGAKEEHVLQVNTYRLMVERGYPVGQKETYKPITINKITLYYLTMMSIVGTGSIMEQTTRFQISDPPIQPNERGRERVQTVENVVPKKRGAKLIDCAPEDCKIVTKNRWRIQRLVPEVPLLNLDEVEAMIHQTAPILVKAFNHGIMPPMVAKEHRHWKCTSYCPVQIREACDAYNETVGETRMVDDEEEEVELVSP